MAKPPNIVFVMADQLSANSVGCYGSGLSSTPTMDKLAAQGVIFNRCYASSPVCAPNRANILTGRSPAIHGIIGNNFVLTQDNPTYAHVLQDNGYRTGGFGKFHQTPMQSPLPESLHYLGFEESVLTEDPKLGPWLDWVEKYHPDHYRAALAVSWPMPYMKEYGENKIDISQHWQAAYAEYVAPLQQKSNWRYMYTSPLPKEIHQTTYITDCSLAFMRRHQENYADQPFFCHVSYVDPHDPYDPPEPYDQMFDPNEMKSPISTPMSVKNNPLLNEVRDRFYFAELDHKPEVVKQLRAKYHGSLRFVDDQIARIVQYLDENDMWENTILIFTTDHGDMMGDHGLISKGNFHYDGSIRCPLIVKGAGIGRGIVSERLTCAFDFFPTFCDLASVELRPPLEGCSFIDSLYGIDEENDGRVCITVEMQKVRTIITQDRWRLTVYDDNHEGELYHLAEDPEERNNLFSVSDVRAKKEELLLQLIQSYMKPSQIPQYRNFPVMNNRKYDVGPAFNFIPTYSRTKN